jgi:hypothetical protein
VESRKRKETNLVNEPELAKETRKEQKTALEAAEQLWYATWKATLELCAASRHFTRAVMPVIHKLWSACKGLVKCCWWKLTPE